MKKFFGWILFLGLAGAVLYQYRSVIFPPKPCTQPIPYTLGTLDARFGISQTDFLSALAQAEAIWEKPSGLNLFAYAPQDSTPDVLKINLVYDYRQKATSQLAALGITVKNDQSSYEALKGQYTALKGQIDQAKKAYDAALLPSEAERQRINNMVTELNSMVVVLNNLADTLNLSVERYNTTNSARGESFEEGVYIENGAGREIDIYEFSAQAKLMRVLAHEFGHALLLDHVTDPKAIMYKFNQGNSENLTAADLAELKARCGIK